MSKIESKSEGTPTVKTTDKNDFRSWADIVCYGDMGAPPRKVCPCCQVDYGEDLEENDEFWNEYLKEPEPILGR